MLAEQHTPQRPELALTRSGDGSLQIRLSGAWQLRAEVPSPDIADRELQSSLPRRVTFDTTQLTAWDSGLLTFLTRVSELCSQLEIPTERDGLPSGVQRLLALAEAVPERAGARQKTAVPSWLARVGTGLVNSRQPVLEMLAFIGELTVVFARFVRGRARFRTTDLMLLIQQTGADALGIITLISFLVGLILAFVGAVQLLQFGASIYVAD
jgi:phospholipid/cholesterol/gamma-HCH transport system permease protein